MTKTEKSLRAVLETVEPRLRLMALARIVFELPVKELAKLKVGTLQRMIRRRLQGDLKLACRLLTMEYAADSGLEEEDYLIRSRNYGGQYPVSRGSIWRWFKGTDLVQALRRKVSGVMTALSALSGRLWSLVEASPGYEPGFTRLAVQGAPTAEERMTLMESLGFA